MKHFNFSFLPDEEWRVYPGASRYLVSNYGRICTCASRGKSKFTDTYRLKALVRRKSTTDPYEFTTMYADDGTVIQKNIHRLVAELFVPKTYESHDIVRHIISLRDGGTNHANNLQWGTQKDNVHDSIREGTFTYGAVNGNTKLTEEQVIEIRARIASGEARRALAREYGVCQGTIQHLERRITWKNV